MYQACAGYTWTLDAITDVCDIMRSVESFACSTTSSYLGHCPTRECSIPHHSRLPACIRRSHGEDIHDLCTASPILLLTPGLDTFGSIRQLMPTIEALQLHEALFGSRSADRGRENAGMVARGGLDLKKSLCDITRRL
jgi:hypothetical protein